MRKDSEIIRQLICYGFDERADDCDVTLNECLKLYEALIKLDTLEGVYKKARLPIPWASEAHHPSAEPTPSPEGESSEGVVAAAAPGGPPGASAPTAGEDPSGAAAPAPLAGEQNERRENPNKTATELKKRTHARLRAYREEHGLGCFVTLAGKIGHGIDEIVLSRMASGERFGIEVWRHVAEALDREEAEESN